MSTEETQQAPSASATKRHPDTPLTPSQTTLDAPTTTPQELSDDYEFEERIGTGAQGNVFRAKDLRHGRRLVAVKQLRIASLSNWKAYDQFQREAKVLSSLDIPGVAKCYETREYLDLASPSAYIVQEYIHGQSLESLLNADTHLTMRQICQIIVQVLEILQKIHSHDPVVIHRDIKPSNIILTPDGRTYLIDFGAVANPQVQGGGSTIAGTYGYMPPEQLMGQPVPESDIYSLAATAVHLFSGVDPENMTTEDFHLLFEPHMQSMPSALIYTLRAMLDPDAKKRFCDIPELIRIFTEFQKANYEIPASIAKLQNNLLQQDDPQLKQWNTKLATVKRINAPGNIDLWQQLSNQTPRDIPPCYRTLSISDKWALLAEKSLQNSKFFSSFSLGSRIDQFVGILGGTLVRWLKYMFWVPLYKCAKNISNPALHFLSMLIPFVWVIFWCLYLYLMYMHNWFQLPIWILPFILAILAFVVTLFKTDLIGGSHCYCPLNNVSTKQDSVATQKMKVIFNTLLQTGFKTIATIVDVQYVPQSDGIYKNVATNKLVCTKAPLFKIRYCFNPDDDQNPDDLYHEIYTHTPPEGHFEAGDPLPILYYVKFSKRKDYHKNSTVYSMPFPLPMNESLPLEQRIGYSSIKL